MPFKPRKETIPVKAAQPMQITVVDIMGEVHDKYITVYTIMEQSLAFECKTHGISPKQFLNKTIKLSIGQKEALNVYKENFLKESNIEAKLSLVKITLPKILVRIERDEDDKIIFMESQYLIQAKYIDEIKNIKKTNKGN